MFEYDCMNQLATVRSLQQRITEMQPVRLDDRALPTPPELRALLPGGALRRGTITTVQGSLELGLALLASTSASGAWCGAIGVPELGLEAAAGLGIALERLILVPDPGSHALTIAGSLSEVLTAVLLRAGREMRPAEAGRLAARLRDHGTALIVLGPWPGAEGRLSVTGSRWAGLGYGHGMLDVHDLTVQSNDRRGQLRHRVRFSGGRLQAC